MDEIGNILRDAREMKGLTLAEAQQETRINVRYLEALEAGQYHELPSAVHVRGFLRNYARFLDLDPAPLLQRYESSRGRQPLHAVTSSGDEPEGGAIPGRGDQPFFDPVNLDLDGSSVEGGRESAVRIVIIIALLITIGLAASRFLPLLLGRGDGQDNLPAIIESLMAGDDEATAPAATPATPESIMPAETSLPIIPSERNNPAGAATDAAAPPGTRPSLPATMDRIDLRLDITERTWVRVTIDGEVVLEDELTRDDGPFEWEAQQEAQLLTGNATGVFVTINDIELGRLGGRGEVVEERWTTTANQ